MQHGVPVSYTHLDVYKRQDELQADRRRRKLCLSKCGNRSNGAVSYTHLDVYKRQALLQPLLTLNLIL